MARARVSAKGPFAPTPFVSARVPDESTPLKPGGGGAASHETERSTLDLAHLKRWLHENDKALSYTLLTTVATVPTLLFGSLHMASFMQVHHITALQVASAHIFFMVWNTLNDVFAGYASDWYATRLGTRLGLVCGIQAVWVFTSFGPFLPVPEWMTLGAYGTLYYLTCISVQDGCLSIVGVARTALMADITSTEGDCIHLKRLNAILGCTEALVSLGGYAMWSPDSPHHPWPFLGFLAAASSMALLANFYSASRLRGYIAQGPSAEALAAAKQCKNPTMPPIFVFMRSMPRNAWVFIAVSALHEMQGVAWGQLAIPLMEILLADVAKFWRVFFLGSMGSVAGGVAFLMTWPAEKAGLYDVLLWTFRLKACLALLLGSLICMLGLSTALVGLCMLLNECTMAMVSGFRLVVLVSVLDELAAQRSAGGQGHPLAAYPGTCGSGLLVGVSAFFSKPLNSVGPVLGAALLSRDDAKSPEGQLRAVALLAALPLVTGLGQWLLWGRFFTLRGRPGHAAVEEAAAA